jgi:NAD(P)H-hydrate epimerase
MAQGLKPLDAAKLGALIHGEAADHLLDTHGYRGLIAEDLLDEIPTIISQYERT